MGSPAATVHNVMGKAVQNMENPKIMEMNLSSLTESEVVLS